MKTTLPLPSPAFLRKRHAAEYLGMSIDIFEKNIRDGIIENGSKLHPNSKTSTVLGWSMEKLNRAKLRIDNVSRKSNEDEDFDAALANFDKEINTHARN